MKIIDSHCHIHKKDWVINYRKDDFYADKFDLNFDEKLILKEMSPANVDMTIIFPLPSIYVDIDKANSCTVEVANNYSDKFIPFTIIDNKPNFWLECGVKGFKEHTFGQRIQKDQNKKDIFSQKFKQTYKIMEQKRIPLLLHAGVNRVERIKNDILKDTPDLIIILAHLGADFPKHNKYQPEIKQVMNTVSTLKTYNNVYFDLSVVLDKEIIRQSVDILGTKKIIFGSDFPYEKPIKMIQRIDSLNLSQSDKENIYSKNISKILGL